MSPDTIAKLFSRRMKGMKNRGWTLASHLLLASGTHHVLSAGTWDRIEDDIDGLEVERYAEWRLRSLRVLPAAVFVWRDELVPQYQRTWGRTTFFHVGADAPDVTDQEADRYLIEAQSEAPSALVQRLERRVSAAVVQRPGDGKLDFRPWIPDDELQLIFEGFPPATIDTPALRDTQSPQAASGESACHGGPSSAGHPRANVESSEERQRRRMDRLHALGGDRARIRGSWKATGRRGAAAELAREERVNDRPRSDPADVLKDLNIEAERRAARRAIGAPLGLPEDTLKTP